jgi:hypothetical protein
MHVNNWMSSVLKHHIDILENILSARQMPLLMCNKMMELYKSLIVEPEDSKLSEPNPEPVP